MIPVKVLLVQMKKNVRVSPVSLIQDHDLVFSGRECHFLLGKHLDLVSHDIDTSAPKQKASLAYNLQQS
jgi:hypothetical protein